MPIFELLLASRIARHRGKANRYYESHLLTNQTKSHFHKPSHVSHILKLNSERLPTAKCSIISFTAKQLPYLYLRGGQHAVQRRVSEGQIT